jgi:hypothetical protein
MKRHITCEIPCFLNSVCLRDNYVKYNTTRQTVDDRVQYGAKNIRFTCLLIKPRIIICFFFNLKDLLYRNYVQHVRQVTKLFPLPV